MKTTWEVEQRLIGWAVVKVDSGTVAGMLIKPFRKRERWFLRFSSALRYAAARLETAHVGVSGRRAA